MNRSSALKWAGHMASRPWRLDCAQLRYRVGDEDWGSPAGALADFLDPEGWTVAWDGVSLLWHGEQFTLPPEWLRKVRAKSDPLEWPYLTSWGAAVDWVRDGYARL